MELLIFLALIFFIVLIHEFGHLLVAKAFNVGVPVYSIGFGPRLIGFKFYKGKISYRILNNPPSNSKVWNFGETEYRIAPIPFGGFCSMQGEMTDSGIPNAKDLTSKPFYQKVLVALGGAAANIITGFLAIVAMLIPKAGFINAFKYTINGVIDSVRVAFYYFYLLFLGEVPLATWSDVSEGVSNITGFQEAMVYFGILSIIMALFNLIPFPALDGSLPFLWGLEKVFGKNLGQKLAAGIAFVGFVLLMVLQALIVIYWIIMP